MKNFGVILSEYLEKLEITQSSAAQLIGCSRSMIYSVLNGEKKLTESKFQHMLSAIPFTDSQISALRYSYYADKYPSGAIDKIYKINHFMSGRHENDGSVSAPPTPLPEESGAVMGEWDILGTIAAVIRDEKATVVTTNFPFTNKNIDDTVFTSLSARETPLNFRHIVEFQSSNDSDINITNLFLSMRYIRCRYNPYYYYSDSFSDRKHYIFPYYVLSDRYAFFFNNNMHSGMFITEDSIIKTVNGMTDAFLENCEPLAIYPSDVFELKSTITKVSSNKISYAFGNSACIIPFVPEMIEKIADKDLPNRDILIKIAVDHYNKLGQHSGYVLFPQSALERFAENGRVYNFPLSWTCPLSYSDRQKVLEVIKTYADGDNPKIKILYDSNLQISDCCMCVDIFERYMSISGSLEGESDHYGGEYSIFVKNTSIISDFRFYVDFIKRNRIHLPSEIAVSYMDSLILECERNKKNENQ